MNYRKKGKQTMNNTNLNLTGCQNRLIPLAEWDKFYPYPTVKGLRQLLFKSEFNGFEKVVRRVGKKILILESAFFTWVDEQNEKSKKCK